MKDFYEKKIWKIKKKFFTIFFFFFDRDLALLSRSYNFKSCYGDFLKFTSIVCKGKCSLPVYFSISSFLIVVCKVKCSLPVYFSICVVFHYHWNLEWYIFKYSLPKLFWNARISKYFQNLKIILEC